MHCEPAAEGSAKPEGSTKLEGSIKLEGADWTFFFFDNRASRIKSNFLCRFLRFPVPDGMITSNIKATEVNSARAKTVASKTTLF